MTGGNAAWVAERVRFRYGPRLAAAVDDVSITVERGTLVALLGPNGAGKSTLLRLLVGRRTPERGSISFGGRPIPSWEAAALARRVGVLPQIESPAFPIKVRDLVAMGRFPHLGPWGREGAADSEAIQRALARCRVDGLAERFYTTLSGGERQRVRLARALAQEPQALALDEPTASLDLAHEMEIWSLLRSEVDRGRTVLLTTHHVNLAARYADRLVLLDRGRMNGEGAPSDVLRDDTIARVFGWPVRIAPHGGSGADRHAPQIIPLREADESTHPKGN